MRAFCRVLAWSALAVTTSSRAWALGGLATSDGLPGC